MGMNELVQLQAVRKKVIGLLSRTIANIELELKQMTPLNFGSKKEKIMGSIDSYTQELRYIKSKNYKPKTYPFQLIMTEENRWLGIRTSTANLTRENIEPFKEDIRVVLSELKKQLKFDEEVLERAIREQAA